MLLFSSGLSFLMQSCWDVLLLPAVCLLDFKRWPLFPCWNKSFDMASEAGGFRDMARKPVRPMSFHQRCSYNVEPQRITANNSISFLLGSSDNVFTSCYRNVLKHMDRDHVCQVSPTPPPPTLPQLKSPTNPFSQNISGKYP